MLISPLCSVPATSTVYESWSSAAATLTVGIAADAASVLAFDPDATAIESARRSLPAELAGRVDYRVASGAKIALEPRSFDLTVFSWSL